MIRLNVLVEGQTEEAFIKDVLAPTLWRHEIYATPRLVTTSRKKRAKGGMTTWLKVRNDLLRWMRSDQNPEARFTTMFDLYALPKEFPGYEEAQKERDPLKKVGLIEGAFFQDIGSTRFVPYIQCHEFEALLLSNPTMFLNMFPDAPKEIDGLSKECKEFFSPEHINEGRETAPSKRILRFLPTYSKTSSGLLIAKEIGLNTIRESCRHFDGWVTRLEDLTE